MIISSLVMPPCVPNCGCALSSSKKGYCKALCAVAKAVKAKEQAKEVGEVKKSSGTADNAAM